MRAQNVQNNFASGVLEPRLDGRTDIEQYYKGLRSAQNCLTIPLGGATRRPGMRYIDTLPRTCEEIVATPSVPNGGTATNINDYDDTTNTTTTINISTVDPYVVAEYNLGSAQNLQFIDVVNISVTSGSTDEFYVQSSSDGVSWSDVGQLTTVDTTPRSYRFEGLNIQYIRLAKIGGTDLGTDKVTLSGFWAYEVGGLSEVQLREFPITDTVKFILALTDLNIAVYENGSLKTNIRSPWPSSVVKEVDSARSDIIMLFVQEDYSPRRLIYDTVNDSFVFDEIPFQSLPTFDYNDDDSPTPTQGQYDINFTGYTTSQLYKVQIDGYTTEEIIFESVGINNINNLTSALEALPIIGAGGVTVTNPLGVLRITFADSTTNNYDGKISAYPTTGSGGTNSVTTVITGVPRSEPVWSETRGYPRSLTFYQSRLWFGGTKSKPQSIFASRLRSFFEFDPRTGLDSDPIFSDLNTRRRNTINRIFASRTLSIYTSDSEFAIEDGPVKTPDFAVNSQTSHGSDQITPVDIDGTVLFLQSGSGALREFVFEFGEGAYISSDLSLLSQHLIDEPIDMAAVRPTESENANYVIIINSDGTGVVYDTMRSQNVTNFMPITTDGSMTAVESLEGDVYFNTVRAYNGQDENSLEIWDYSSYTDASVKVSQAPSDTVILGTNHLDGLECRVRADGSVMDNETPSSGTITLSRDGEDVEVGLNYDCSLTPMPLASNNTPAHKKKIAKQYILVYETVGGWNVDGTRVTPSRQFGDSSVSAFQSPQPYTGLIGPVEGQEGWANTLTFTLNFPDPTPFTVLYIETIFEVK